MTPTEATEYLDRLRARGIVVSFDGGALDVEGPATATDREQLAAHAVAVADVLRRRAAQVSQPEAHAEASAQPETHPGLPAVPTAPETPSLLERFEARERERLRTFRGRPITPAEVRQCLVSSGDWDAYRAGTLSADDAYEMTRAWLRNRQPVTDFAHNLFND